MQWFVQRNPFSALRERLARWRIEQLVGHRPSKVYSQPPENPQARMVRIAEQLTPGSFAVFSAETAKEACGDSQLAKLMLITSLRPADDYLVAIDENDSLTVRRHPSSSDHASR